MSSNELYEEFLKHCKEYETDLWGIVIKKGDTCLRIKKPSNNSDATYLIYTIIGEGQIQGIASDIDELLEICEETLGEDSIIKNHKHDQNHSYEFDDAYDYGDNYDDDYGYGKRC